MELQPPAMMPEKQHIRNILRTHLEVASESWRTIEN
jgi:hypothetical protein